MVFAWVYLSAQVFADSGKLSFEALAHQVEIARAMRALDLSRQQITAWQALAQQVHEPLAQLKAFRESADAKAALRKVRDAALSAPEDDSVWLAFEPLIEEQTRLESALHETAARAAREAVELLSSAQLARLLLLRIGSPQEWLEQLAQNRAVEPSAWRQWRDEVCRELARQIGAREDEEPPAEAAQALKQFFDRLRNMPTDDFFERREALARELRAVLLEQITATLTDQSRAGAVQTLQQWMTSEGFPDTLARMAELAR